MITARDLHLRAGERELLTDLSFTFEAAEFVAVLGPNGVGKSTLLRTIAGLQRPASGSVTIDDVPVNTMKATERARRIALLATDDVFLERLAVQDVVSMGRFAHHQWWHWSEDREDARVVESAIAAVGLREFADRPFATLSSGERQRVWIALALAQESPVLLLDEPTTHMDVRVAHEILSLLKRQRDAGKTVVCVLHDLNEASEFADRVLLLGCGEMLA
ncbi:MAG: ABC transporter ATP-binding protein, partial [Candidatus Eremiobacteraeota bacterium]|nr:ABC transporter ATP-binding protein [Candidatus Eremiobacteraeota bacterium]